VRFVQVRHEESAALMACAHAKLTGKLGCCLATTGPGGIHLLNGLYDAKFDRAPVIAVTGLPYHDLVDTFTQQDVDHNRLFADVALYTTRIMSATHVDNAVALACRTAIAGCGVAHLSILAAPIAGGSASPTQNTGKREQYRRAMTACLEARGYSVK
jgi:pyruvate dehydrogenase (quinone)